jgi:hypothetical protein
VLAHRRNFIRGRSIPPGSPLHIFRIKIEVLGQPAFLSRESVAKKSFAARLNAEMESKPLYLTDWPSGLMKCDELMNVKKRRAQT